MAIAIHSVAWADGRMGFRRRDHFEEQRHRVASLVWGGRPVASGNPWGAADLNPRVSAAGR
jgi:hypothetical protein